jgi:hypothetical protein
MLFHQKNDTGPARWDTAGAHADLPGGGGGDFHVIFLGGF